MSMSSIGKFKNDFDPAGLLIEQDTIGSYLVSASGALVTSQSVNGNESLRVVMASQFAEDAASASGDLGIGVLAVRNDVEGSLVDADGDYGHLQLDALGRLRVVADLNVNNDFVYAEDSAAVGGELGASVLLVRQDTLAISTSADGDFGQFKSTNLGELYVSDPAARASLVSILAELASISQVEDAAHVSGDSGVMSLAVRNDTPGSLVSANGDYAPLQVDALGNLRIIGAVTIGGAYAEDSVAVSGDIGLSVLAVRKDALSSNVSADGDYATPIVWSEGSLKTVDIPNIAATIAAITVTTTQTSLGTPIANRRNSMVQNRGGASIFVGPTGVTAATGIEVPKGASMDIDFGPAVTWFAITATGTADARVLQLS